MAAIVSEEDVVSTSKIRIRRDSAPCPANVGTPRADLTASQARKSEYVATVGTALIKYFTLPLSRGDHPGQ
eukprot:6199525-Pleurochrysis_carterae.AAC.11